MDTLSWTIRFKGYLPIDHRMGDRLRRVMGNIREVPESAIEIDEAQRIVTIDYSQVSGWFEEAQKVVKAQRIGDRITVRPPWDEYAAADDEIVLVIDAGPVFGTGLHETTALCIEALEKHIKQGCCALDFGSGSGILAIAAAKLGASTVTAVEGDSEAVQIARRNVSANGVESIVTVFEAMTPEVDAPPADVITANIIAPVLIANLVPLKKMMTNGAVLVLSGLNRKTHREVEEALPGAGLVLIDKVSMGQWFSLTTRSAHSERRKQ